MDDLLKRRIEGVIRSYFAGGKADRLRSEGYDEIKRLVWRSGGLWKDYRNRIAGYIKEVQEELKREFAEGHVSRRDDVIKSQLAGIIERTKTTLSGRAGEAQSVIKEALERSYTEGGDWQRYARRGFERIRMEEKHVATEIETTKAALNNLKRYRNFREADDSKVFYRYEGPETVRVFCADHLNRVYRLDELSGMTNQFGQPAFSYCGGYNCRHRWAPVIGEMDGSLFIDESWQKKYEGASKRQQGIMEREKEFARKAAGMGKRAELNSSLDRKYGKDTDLIFEGSYAQLKQPTTNNINSLGRLPNSKQADTIIIEIGNVPENYKRLLGKYQNWVKNHSDKRIILSINNIFEEIEA